MNAPVPVHPHEHPHHMQVDPRVHRIELLISHVLRIGVSVSLLVIVAGTAVSFARHWDYLSSKGAMHRLAGEEAVFPHSLGQVWEGLGQGSGGAIVAVGLLLLIATPVMRVAISIFAFGFQKDRAFVVITSIVLILLLVSFFLGKVE